MILVPFEARHLRELMTWFPDLRSCRRWGGPHFRHPFDEQTFRADSLVDSMRTFAMEIDDHSMIAFGQYYPKAGRCHLARLVVAPAWRGRGYGERLIRNLCRSARQDLGLDIYSLYVLHSNKEALRLYERLGFVVAKAPDMLLSENEPILFMVAQGEAAAALSA